MTLDKKKINFYQEKGVVLLKNIISQDWLKKLEKGIKKNFKNPSKYKCVYEKNGTKELFYDDYCNWQRINEYKDFLFNSEITNIALELMKSKKVNLFHEHVLIKESGAKKRLHGIKINLIIVLKDVKMYLFGSPLIKYIKIIPQNSSQIHTNGHKTFYQLNFLVMIMNILTKTLKKFQI